MLTREPLDKEKTDLFRNNCAAYLKESLGILGEHRGWKKINLTFLMLFSFPISLPLYAGGLFSFKTDSAKKLLDFDADLSKESPAC
jgi:hypothetical protein